MREVLGAKYDMGLFHDPYLRIGTAADDPADLNADSRLHRAAGARRGAQVDGAAGEPQPARCR